MRALPTEAEQFLRKLSAALAGLPSADRDDIVAEIRSHLAERAARGEADLVAPFGPPEAYAASFLQERALAGALARGSSWALGRALASGARRAGGWYAVLVLAILHLYGIGLVAMAALKPLFPANVGMFVGDGKFGLGAHFGPEAEYKYSGTREVLGWWAIPIFLVAGALILHAANWALRHLARRRLVQLRSGLWA